MLFLGRMGRIVPPLVALMFLGCQAQDAPLTSAYADQDPSSARAPSGIEPGFDPKARHCEMLTENPQCLATLVVSTIAVTGCKLFNLEKKHTINVTNTSNIKFMCHDNESFQNACRTQAAEIYNASLGIEQRCLMDVDQSRKECENDNVIEGMPTHFDEAIRMCRSERNYVCEEWPAEKLQHPPFRKIGRPAILDPSRPNP